MAMPKNITLVHKDKGFSKPLSFAHAVKFLKSPSGKYFELPKGFKWGGNDIVRTKKEKKEETEQ